MKIPPEEMMYDGPKEFFISNGLEFFEHYKTLCGLQPNARMLDVGSGLGRKTIPLTNYLTTGSYEGFDCKREGIEWCQQNITFPNFKFQHVDVYAPGYNKTGQIYSWQFKFPYPDNEFDFVVANSVFTHMLELGIINYMKEIHRVLKPGGRCLITWFIWDKHCQPPIFKHIHDTGWYANKDFIEEAICFNLDWVREAYASLSKNWLWFKGTWTEEPGLSYQDIIIASK